MRKNKEQMKLAPDIEPLTPFQQAMKELYHREWGRTMGNISKTARSLGVSFPTARKHLIRFGIYTPGKCS